MALCHFEPVLVVQEDQKCIHYLCSMTVMTEAKNEKKILYFVTSSTLKVQHI